MLACFETKALPHDPDFKALHHVQQQCPCPGKRFAQQQVSVKSKGNRVARTTSALTTTRLAQNQVNASATKGESYA